MGAKHPSYATLYPFLTSGRRAGRMTAYRRARRPGGSYFFTLALADRQATTLTDRIDDLRGAFATTLAERPFRCDAMVVLPDHLHAVWTLPDGDSDYSTRWRLIKARFSRAVRPSARRSASKLAKRERGLWQRRFWEHLIRDDEDMNLHVRYCWGNPVTHGYVARPSDWPYSSLHRDVRRGQVDDAWVASAIEGDFGE